MPDDALIDLAQQTQRRHAELIAEANKRSSIEARREVRDDLDALRQDFTTRALTMTGVSAPFMWMAENPDHAVALAVRNDIADTEEKLSRLANGAVFQKMVVASMPGGPLLPPGPDWTKILTILGVVLIGYAIFTSHINR